MKYTRFLLIAILALTFSVSANAQTITGTVPIKWVSTLPTKCKATDKARALSYRYSATIGLYYCSADNTWTAITATPASYGDGSAAAPSITFALDTDTGLYRSGANTLNFATGGTLRATLSSAGLFTTTGGLSSTTGAYSSSITSTLGTITSSTPAFTNTATWNSGGVTFTNIFSNVTDTASAAASLLIDLQVGGTSQFKVTKGGAGTFTGSLSATGIFFGGSGSAGAPQYSFTSDTDTGIYNNAANGLAGSVGGARYLQLSSGTSGLGDIDGNGSSKVITINQAGDIAINAQGANVTVTAAASNFNGSILSSGATSGVGYATGAGGTVTQATSRTTGVTLNKVTGSITLVSAAGSATPASFTVTNSAVAATDTPHCVQKSGTDKYIILITAVGAGSFEITFYTTGGTTTEQPVFNCSIIKGVAS